MNLNLKKQQELIDKIIQLGALSYPAQGFNFWEKEETKEKLEKYKEEAEKSEEILINLLNDEGKKELKKFINILTEIEFIKMNNAFNNGVREGFNDLSFLKEYFEVL